MLAGLLRRLWVTPPAGHAFRPLQAMCDEWATEFEAKRAAGRATMVDAGLARAGMDLFRSLPATTDRSVLLCTDLHAANVLAAEREPWLVIDPKPHVGDPAYDPVQHMLNCDERLRADPARPGASYSRPARPRPRTPAAVAVRPLRPGVARLARPGRRGPPDRFRPAGRPRRREVHASPSELMPGASRGVICGLMPDLLDMLDQQIKESIARGSGHAGAAMGRPHRDHDEAEQSGCSASTSVTCSRSATRAGCCSTDRWSTTAPRGHLHLRGPGRRQRAGAGRGRPSVRAGRLRVDARPWFGLAGDTI